MRSLYGYKRTYILSLPEYIESFEHISNMEHWISEAHIASLLRGMIHTNHI